MKGHIIQRSPGSYSLVIELGAHPETGKRQQKWITFRGTKRDAENELNRRLNEVDSGNFVDPTKITVAEYFSEWLTVIAAQKVSGKTLERYQSIITQHIAPPFGKLPLQRLTALHIETHYAHAAKNGRKDGRAGGLSGQTILHHHRLLAEALKKAVKWKYIKNNPTDGVEAPKVRTREVQPIDETQAVWLLTVAEGTRLYTPIMLAIYAGLRRGEILALRWQDVDWELGLLKVRRALEETKVGGLRFKEPKSKNGRRPIAVPKLALEALLRHQERQHAYRESLAGGYEDNDLICCVEDEAVWAPSAFTSAYRALLKRRKLSGPNFHALRHSHASQLLKDGVDIKVISKRLGHSRASFTMDVYAHLMPGQDEEAAIRIDSRYRKAFDALATQKPQ